MNFIGPYSDLPYHAYPVSRPGRHTDIRKVSTAKGFPVTLEEIKEDLRVDSGDEDATIMRMARAAAAFLEIRTACSVLAGRYEAHFADWCLAGPWEFNRWPLREVTEIAWLDGRSTTTPTWRALDLTQFFIDVRSRSFLVMPHRTFSAPAPWAPFNGIRVRFIAGWDVDLVSGETGDQVSESEDLDAPLPMDDGMRTLLMLMIGHYYENRELFVSGKISDVDQGASSLLLGYRQFW